MGHHIFSYSKAGSKLSCGGTKAEALVTDVLALLNITDFLEILKNPHNLSFSFSTNAFNRRNRKMFQMCIHYYDP
jgi:hypothetical protein